MKRDMDLIRQILITVEESPHGFFRGELTLEGYSEEQIGYHCYLLCEAALAHGHDITARGSQSPTWLLTRLTWAGHEFVEAARPQTRWNEAKSIMNRIGGAALTVWQKVLGSVSERLSSQH